MQNQDEKKPESVIHIKLGVKGTIYHPVVVQVNSMYIDTKVNKNEVVPFNYKVITQCEYKFLNAKNPFQYLDFFLLSLKFKSEIEKIPVEQKLRNIWQVGESIEDSWVIRLIEEDLVLDSS